MEGRPLDELNRVATPLELLFDLTFVVAIAQAAGGLAEAIEAGHAYTGAGSFVMVFFAIWWAWMNFTWFASAYDADDVPYRVATFVQMAGALVLAAGVGPALESGEYVAVTLGYAIMRLGLVSLWLRAAIQHRPGRATALRYAAGIAVLQVLWGGRLVAPDYEQFEVASFIALALLEVAVPIWAERTGGTSWHPHHIAERYGLFTIVLLGESVLAATNAVREFAQDTVNGELLAVSSAGLVILASVWWLYFAEARGDTLVARRGWSFVWGYGHFGIFLGIASAGAGLEVNVAAAAHGDHAAHLPDALTAGSVLVPVTLVLILLGMLRAPQTRPRTDWWTIPASVVALIALLGLATIWGPRAAMIGAAASLIVLVACVTVRQEKRGTLTSSELSTS